MQTRGAGDDADGSEKDSPPLRSFSVCIFSYLGSTNVSDATGVILHLNIDFAGELGETPAWSFRIRALSK
jgi:hypothetical protein